MLTGIRHTAAMLLGLVLLALVVACGDPATTSIGVSIPEPTPDIEATVEAKVQERLRIEATVEAKVREGLRIEATGEAKVREGLREATAEAKAKTKAKAKAKGGAIAVRSGHRSFACPGTRPYCG